MGTQQGRARLVIQASTSWAQIGGLWWPHQRLLGDELPSLFASWPLTEGHIVGVFFAPWDWNDRPRNVAIPQRRGLVPTRALLSAPHHLIKLVLLNRTHISLAVVAPDAADEVVTGTFERLAFGSPLPDWAPRRAHAIRPRLLS